MTLGIFVGHNEKSEVDSKVLEYSIRKRSSIPVDIKMLPRHSTILTHPFEVFQTTPSSFTRFLTPYLWDFKGFSVYMDPDMLCFCDIKELYDMIDPNYTIQVIKHNYDPKYKVKYVGKEIKQQPIYERKNWSSLIIFNNKKCKEVYSYEMVNTSTGLALHQFKNLLDDQIGSLPKEYNYLVEEENQAEDAKIAHFTNGMPYIPSFSNVKYAAEWFRELEDVYTTNT